MKIKRFYAADIRQVMQMVKDELGHDAVIMSNRSVDGGVEIVAAKDFDEQTVQDKVKEQTVVPKDFKSLNKLETSLTKPHIVSSSRKHASTPSTPLKNSKVRSKLDEYIGYAEKDFIKNIAPVNQQRRNAAIVKPKVSFEPLPSPEVIKKRKQQDLIMDDKPEDNNFQGTLDQIKESLGSATEEMFQKMRTDMRKEMRYLRTVMGSNLESEEAEKNNPVRLELLSRLADIGLSQKLSLKIANRLDSHVDSDVIWVKALEMLRKVLPIMETDIIKEGGVVALIGPTGVGKTTTIAKLAAQYILKQGMSEHVVMITMDNYRIGAHEQLSIYGRILDVPVRVAADGVELRTLIESFSHKRLILIDTAGVSQKDVRMLEQTESLANSGIAVKTYLVMSATTQLKSMNDIIEGFEPDGCILTKMDETAETGNAISALIEYQLPLAFVTDGQEVPEDIHHASADELIKKCLSESKRISDSNYLDDEEWMAASYA